MTYPDLAMIIPVWFEETVPEDLIRERLLRTLTGVGHYVHPGKVALVVDGDGRSAEILRSLHPEFERFSLDARAVVSEPLTELTEFWVEVPESTALTVNGGVMNCTDFAPQAP